jgi:CheY-like chemotaxis protein
MGETPLVLVVEDDHLAVTFIEEALKDGGFRSVSVASGEEAIALFEDGEDNYQALATDINLFSTIDGWEVARTVRDLNPELPVIYMTGSAATDWGAKGVPKSILLSKPFASAQLITAVSQLLNGSTPPTPDG